MPARGNIDYLGLNAKKRNERSARDAGSSSTGAPGGELAEPGVAMIAEAHKRGAPSAPAQAGASAKRSKSQDDSKGIVTVTRRQDAEPLNKQPITMREIFPKVRPQRERARMRYPWELTSHVICLCPQEFWRI